METHVKIVGWAHLVLGALGVLGSLLVALTGVGTGMLAGMGDAAAGLIVGGVTIFAAVLGLVISLPSLVAGWGLLQRKPWGRIAAVIAAVISLFFVPIGTIVGIYTLWAMFQNDTKYVLNA